MSYVNKVVTCILADTGQAKLGVLFAFGLSEALWIAYAISIEPVSDASNYK
jgi:hypothetical protein